MNINISTSYIGTKLLLLVGLSLISCGTFSAWQTASYSTMGTNIVIEVFHKDATTRQIAIADAKTEIERINQRMSTYICNSDVSQLNLHAFEEEVSLSDELFELIKLSKKISTLSDGAFDISYASIGYLYSYPNKIAPSSAQIKQLLPAVNYQNIQLNEAQKSVRFLHQDLKIDLGGIAKGYAVDQAIESIKSTGVEHALVTAGGDTRLLGDRLGKPWIVGIRDPRTKDKQAVIIPLENTAMSTSGDYERYFEEDGQRYHHILSPKTGKSTHDVQSVSIIGQQSVYNDGLSTAVFVLGLEKGLGMINALPGFEAIVMDAERKMHYSDGLKQ